MYCIYKVTNNIKERRQSLEKAIDGLIMELSLYKQKSALKALYQVWVQKLKNI